MLTSLVSFTTRKRDGKHPSHYRCTRVTPVRTPDQPAANSFDGVDRLWTAQNLCGVTEPSITDALRMERDRQECERTMLYRDIIL